MGWCGCKTRLALENTNKKSVSCTIILFCQFGNELTSRISSREIQTSEFWRLCVWDGAGARPARYRRVRALANRRAHVARFTRTSYIKRLYSWLLNGLPEKSKSQSFGSGEYGRVRAQDPLALRRAELQPTPHIQMPQIRGSGRSAQEMHAGVCVCVCTYTYICMYIYVSCRLFICVGI